MTSFARPNLSWRVQTGLISHGEFGKALFVMTSFARPYLSWQVSQGLICHDEFSEAGHVMPIFTSVSSSIAVGVNSHQFYPLLIRRSLRMTGMKMSEAVFSTNMVYFPHCTDWKWKQYCWKEHPVSSNFIYTMYVLEQLVNSKSL